MRIRRHIIAILAVARFGHLLLDVNFKDKYCCRRTLRTQTGKLAFHFFKFVTFSCPKFGRKKRNKRERDPNCCLVVIIELVKVPQFTRPHRSEWWAPSDWLRPQSSATLEPFRHRSLLLRPSVLLAHGLSPAKGNSFFHHIKVT